MGKTINKIFQLIEKVTDEITITAIIFLGATVPINYYWQLMNRPPGIYLAIDPTMSFIFIVFIIILIICLRFLLFPKKDQKEYILKAIFALIAVAAFDIPIILFGQEQYSYYIILMVISAFSFSTLVQIPNIYKKYMKK